MLLRREVGKCWKRVHREPVMQRRQLDGSDVTLISVRDKMILGVARGRVQNNVLPLAKTTNSAGAQKRQHSSIRLTMQKVQIIDQIWIFSNGMHPVVFSKTPDVWPRVSASRSMRTKNSYTRTYVRATDQLHRLKCAQRGLVVRRYKSGQPCPPRRHHPQ